MIIEVRDVHNLLKTAASCPKEKLQEIVAWVDTLTTRERLIIKKYYNLNGENKQSLDEIGKQFDVTRERIKRILERALRKLRRSHESRVKIWRKGCTVAPKQDFRRVKSFIND